MVVPWSAGWGMNMSVLSVSSVPFLLLKLSVSWITVYTNKKCQDVHNNVREYTNNVRQSTNSVRQYSGCQRFVFYDQTFRFFFFLSKKLCFVSFLFEIQKKLQTFLRISISKKNVPQLLPNFFFVFQKSNLKRNISLLKKKLAE